MQRLLRLDVEHTSGIASAVTSDVSPHGAFIVGAGICFGPPGAAVRVVPQGYDVVVTAIVRRTQQADASFVRLPGVALEFHIIRAGSDSALRRFMHDVGGPLGALPGTTRSGDTLFLDGRPLRLSGPIGAVAPSSDRKSDSLPEVLRRARRHVWRGDERRIAPRYELTQDLTYQCGSLPHLGRLLNLSRTGFFIGTPHTVPPAGTLIELDLAVPNAPSGVTLRLRGRVIRQHDPFTEGLPGFGAFITDVHERARVGAFRLLLRRLAVLHESGSVAP
ncbi:MAG: PilZ domain-containing protein [Myxococcales bacterium]|nr:PilZ domain-containing protein [Myxococcales bacterium]